MLVPTLKSAGNLYGPMVVSYLVSLDNTPTAGAHILKHSSKNFDVYSSCYIVIKMYLQLLVCDFGRIGDDSLDFLWNFLVAFWVLSDSIESHCNQVTCSVDSCEVKSNKLMKNFFLLNPPVTVRLSLFLCLLNLLLNQLHLLNVMIQEILLNIRSELCDSILQYGFTLSSDRSNQLIKFFVLFQKISPPGTLPKN